MNPILPAHALDHPGSLKVLLGREASEAIEASGSHHLAVICRADATSPPEARGRLVLVCVPVTDAKLLDDAHRVVAGKAKAQAIKSPPPPSAAPTAEEIRRA